MIRLARRHFILVLSSTLCLLTLLVVLSRRPSASAFQPLLPSDPAPSHSHFIGTKPPRPERYPVTYYQPIPRPQHTYPKIQHKDFRRERWEKASVRRKRQAAVRRAFAQCWHAYRTNAWGQDELRPVQGGGRTRLGGWGVTMVDALDTLWIMGLREEFDEAVEAVRGIDFTRPGNKNNGTSVSVFETTIRYLGGLIGAYDMSGDQRLLTKAVELGDVLYAAFDTPNRMPNNNSNTYYKSHGQKPQATHPFPLAADIGSLSLEFTRLSQITRDPRYHDATHRIMLILAAEQNQTAVPGIWPSAVDAARLDFHTGSEFSLGARSDSLYEYLLKMVALLGGGAPIYEKMYIDAAEAIMTRLLFRPMLPGSPDILMAGKLTVPPYDGGPPTLNPTVEHLSCFAGGMFALGGRLLANDTHINVGRMLTDGCMWAYNAGPLGIMPADFTVVPCPNWTACAWNHTRHREALGSLNSTLSRNFSLSTDGVRDPEHLPFGMTSVTNSEYMLRPEAIESIFIMYRISGNPLYQEMAWRMFSSIVNATETALGANAALEDVTDASAPKRDEMESFWLAQTLKYFYLTFSEPNLVSLDEYVFNAEAHPFIRPKRGFWSWVAS
ncbi:glycoside hydrolase family 47 protein [Acidomyces richmondensis BFW]|nr:MAG: glycoside hydrolase family 47 protein [Acidomyces sp. 'richmondensis']KYG50081.1 glycoside hydrolase family 47 protein [Acidomyces richmondensis BFW]